VSVEERSGRASGSWEEGGGRKGGEGMVGRKEGERGGSKDGAGLGQRPDLMDNGALVQLGAEVVPDLFPANDVAPVPDSNVRGGQSHGCGQRQVVVLHMESVHQGETTIYAAGVYAGT